MDKINVGTLEWYESLEAVSNRTNTIFDFSFAMGDGEQRPPVGRFSSYGEMIKHIQAKERRNWTHYQI